MITGATCGACRFFHPIEPRRLRAEEEPALVGFCRRKAPEFNGLSPYARWPEVREGDWCGEFFHKDAAPTEPMWCPHGAIGSTCHICMAEQLSRYLPPR